VPRRSQIARLLRGADRGPAASSARRRPVSDARASSSCAPSARFLAGAPASAAARAASAASAVLNAATEPRHCKMEAPFPRCFPPTERARSVATPPGGGAWARGRLPSSEAALWAPTPARATRRSGRSSTSATRACRRHRAGHQAARRRLLTDDEVKAVRACASWRPPRARGLGLGAELPCSASPPTRAGPPGRRAPSRSSRCREGPERVVGVGERLLGGAHREVPRTASSATWRCIATRPASSDSAPACARLRAAQSAASTSGCSMTAESPRLRVRRGVEPGRIEVRRGDLSLIEEQGRRCGGLGGDRALRAETRVGPSAQSAASAPARRTWPGPRAWRRASWVQRRGWHRRLSARVRPARGAPDRKPASTIPDAACRKFMECLPRAATGSARVFAALHAESRPAPPR
jgi:hypothetical protein